MAAIKESTNILGIVGRNYVAGKLGQLRMPPLALGFSQVPESMRIAQEWQKKP